MDSTTPNPGAKDGKLGVFCRRVMNTLKHLLSEYETPRLVILRSYPVGIIYRTVQLLIVAYLIGYVFIWTKSYQSFDTAESSVVTKIKGILYRNIAEGSAVIRKEVWDGADFVVPVQETNAFFITTSLLYTANQSQTICPEDPNVGIEGIHCSQDQDCVPGESTPYGNGLRTGRCVPSTSNAELSVCEINGWCPTEFDQTPKSPVLHGFDSLTVLVKNHIAFPKYGLKRRNILDSFDDKYLKSCRFHHVSDPLCPVFKIVDIVSFANESFHQLAVRGGVIAFNIHWDCDLDLSVELCLPNYHFRRLDNEKDKIAKGWNFRHAYYYQDMHGNMRRDLIKSWGIRFVFNVQGVAGKFSAVNFWMNLGSGIGLLGIASLVCEFILMKCIQPTDSLMRQKFLQLKDIKEPASQSSGLFYRNNRNDASFLDGAAVCDNCTLQEGAPLAYIDEFGSSHS
ncbi:hypothetical protein RvY_07861 [Ramazzottius varieornatus]|uniref:Uncharacterized protein n=1 Tax=Ramazzottius varieornatus TaxID=947166 RepID=A0A1D1V3R0_RAMVA|nr:hypothetical protein RvY_07861 [Ramazzottius varieornatus]